MRVALTVYNANFLGGGNKFTAALATSLSGAGFDVALCAGNKPVPGRCHKEFVEARRLYTASPLKPTRRAKLYSSTLLVGVALKRCMRRFNPDVVINADSPPAVFSLIGKGKTKFIQYVHWPTELQAYRHSMLLELYRAFYWGLHYQSLKRLDAAVCNSNFTQGMARIMWRAELPADRFHVIYPAADLNKFQGSYVDRKKKICYVGRLDGNKGIDMVIDAFLKVHDNHPDLELEIAGAVNPGDVYTTAYYPRLRNRLFKLAKREITLRLNPSDDEIVNVYKSSRIFANFNPGEHFGICVVESQAAGAVPIVAHGGGQVETVSNGETGFLVNSSEEMVNRMELLLSDDLTFKRMSEKAMERAKLFSIETFTEKWINLIQDVTI